MTKKYSELISFINEASILNAPQPENAPYEQPVITKFKYHVDKMVTRIKVAIKKSNIETEYQENIQDARIENASEDKDGNILRDGQSYKYTKANEKKLIKEIRLFTNVLNDSAVEVEPNILTQVPELTASQYEAFKGLLVAEDYEIGLHISKNENFH